MYKLSIFLFTESFSSNSGNHMYIFSILCDDSETILSLASRLNQVPLQEYAYQCLRGIVVL